MKTESIRPFAMFGSEKMFYDLRMGPQMVRNGDTLYIVYQANGQEIFADPYIVTYGIMSKTWSGPYKIGDAERYDFDHHLCPILWFDDEGYLHVLFNCHGQAGSHRISRRPFSVDAWVDGPAISESISYPHVFRLPGNRVCLYFRAYGHMGYWAYMLSNDGGYNWSKPVKVVDFDQDPESDQDTWAGSYHTTELDTDGHTLHVGFTYFDERGIWKFVHPRYHRMPSVNTRYHLYYLSIDLDTGIVRNMEGDILPCPLNRRMAEGCKLWDSGDYLTMMPAMLLSETTADVSFLLPVTEETEWKCGFLYIRKVHGAWKRTRITQTNTTWSGCRLYREADGTIVAYLIVGRTDGSLYTYGAGQLERWTSEDDGEHWVFQERYAPDAEDLYNNPIFAEDASHSGRKDSSLVAYYGWTGPYSMQPVIDKKTDIPIINRGKAYLLHDGKYVSG